MTASYSPPHVLPARLQDLSPAGARFCLRIERVMRQIVGDVQNRHVLLACSAGSDSLALLLVLRVLAPRLNLRLTAGHLDHGLRQESRNEAETLSHLCKAIHVPLVTGHSDVGLYARKTDLGIEEAGRTLRYRFLFGLRKRIAADVVMTAHHADDLAEDVLMRLLRGTGWPGLAGMPSWDPDRGLARPLLYTSKKSLQAFLRALNLTWLEDTSNENQRFLRNRIRKTMLPGIKREFPGMHRSIAHIHALGTLDRDYFSAQLEPLLSKAKAQGWCLHRTDLEALHAALRLRLCKALLDGLGPGQVRHDALLRLERAWQDKRTGAMIQFSGGKTVQITAQGMQFAAPR